MIRRIVIISLLTITCSAVYGADTEFKDGLSLYLKGEVEKAVEIWKIIGEKGDVQAQKQLGQYYLADHEYRDYQKAIDWYSKAVSQGDREAAGYLKNAEAQLAKWKKLANELGQQAAYETITFREHILEGDDTHCGFVIEVKSKVVLVQTSKNPRWYKKNDLYPPATKQCSSQ